jgi:hypothetical protein
VGGGRDSRLLTFIGLRSARRQVPVRRPQMSYEKEPLRERGLSEAGVSGGGRTKPAVEGHPIAPLKSGMSDERIGGAPVGSGRPVLTAMRRVPRARSSPNIFHPSSEPAHVDLGQRVEMNEPCGMPSRLSRASAVRVLRPRSSVSLPRGSPATCRLTPRRKWSGATKGAGTRAVDSA